MNKDWLDIAVLEDYLDGKLDAKTMNRVEREALEDPFVAEALAGLSESPSRSLNSLSLLQKQLQERVSEQQHTKKASVITWQRLSIAATAAVMFVAVSIMFWMRQENRQKELAGMPKKVDVTIAPKEFKDSLPVAADAIAANDVAKSSADKATVAVDKAIVAAKEDRYAGLKAKPRPVITAAEATAELDNKVVSVDAEPAKEVVMAAPVQKKLGVAPPEAVAATARQERAVLNETVITGYNAEKGKALARVKANEPSGGYPLSGWPEYNEYLIQKNRYSKDAKAGDSVQVSFGVKDQKPVDISVVKGISERFDKEVVRLIKEGSHWQVQDPQKPVVSITMRF